jgi:ribosomal protein S18 acetylase RimI-like enzyme
MQYKLTPIELKDYEWLERLRRSVYQELFIKTWGAWDEQRHKRHFQSCLENGHIYIVDVNGNHVGMLQLFENVEYIEIGEIQVLPEHQGRGLGTVIINDVIATARGRKIPVRLKVGLRNDSAMRLYQRLGFQVLEESETHYHMGIK